MKLFSTPALDAVRYGSASKMTTNEKLRRQAAAKNYQTMPKLFSTPALDKLKSATGAKTSSSAGSVKKQTNYYTPTKSSGSSSSSVPVYTPPPVSQFQTTSMKASNPASAKSVDNWVNQLKKELKNQSKNKPKLPKQVDLNKYRTEMATIRDLEKKFGFDYSRDYAERQAEILAQAQRDAIQTARERADYELQSAQTDLEHDFFQQFREQQQQLVDSGLNAGIAAERELRLDMNRQHALADILANAQLYNQELDRNLSQVERERLAYAEQLYNERLAQAFSQAMDMSRFQQSENQWMAQMAMEQRRQAVEEAWREFEWNNMSYAERMKLLADAERFGMEMAWERHKFDAGLAFDAAYAGGGAAFSQGGAGGWKTSKGEPPQSFKNHLSAALNATGFPASWIQPVSELIARESTWNPKAKNPKSTAHGYGQFLQSTRSNYEKKYGIKYDTPVNQLILTLYYIRDRYGDPFKALQHHNQKNWY